MSSGKQTHASADNKPKFAPVDENAPDNRSDIYATNQLNKIIWQLLNNDNPNAQPEVLLVIGVNLVATSNNNSDWEHQL